MKKKHISAILMLAVSAVGCGSKSADIQTADVQNVNIETEVSVTEMETEKNIETVIPVKETADREECVYQESIDLFEMYDFDMDGEELDLSQFEEFKEACTLTESIDIYSDWGTYAGYTKPDINAYALKRNDEWVMVAFAKSTYLVKADDFERAAVMEKPNDKEAVLAQNDDVPVKSAAEAPTKTNADVPAVELLEEVSPENEQPAQQESTKYTPEEAIAVYRSIMEANGIKWNPDLKNGGSWGTGWIYLEKGQPEWCAATDLESVKMGNGDGVPWDNYYLEVTGFDENAVYITEWAD